VTIHDGESLVLGMGELSADRQRRKFQLVVTTDVGPRVIGDGFIGGQK
jgi:hypothetical protein